MKVYPKYTSQREKSVMCHQMQVQTGRKRGEGADGASPHTHDKVYVRKTRSLVHISVWRLLSFSVSDDGVPSPSPSLPPARQAGMHRRSGWWMGEWEHVGRGARVCVWISLYLPPLSLASKSKTHNIRTITCCSETKKNKPMGP